MKTIIQKLTVSLILILSLQGLVYGQDVDGTYKVTETWHVRLEYRNWGAGRITTTKTFGGTASGTIKITNGRYRLIDRTGVAWANPPGHDLKARDAYAFGGYVSVSGDYAFAPAFGVVPYGLVFAGCFAVSVPLLDGEVPAFYNYDDFSGSGTDLAHMQGSGNMLGDDLKAYVSSTFSFSKVTGIVQQPTSQEVLAGQDALFQVLAGGEPPLKYSWRKAGVPIPGATNSVLRLSNVRSSDASSYSVVVSASGGTVTSTAAKLTVGAPPAGPWLEGFEAAPLGSSVPSSNTIVAIPGDQGFWSIGDTIAFFPDCAPDNNHADIVVENGSKVLRLVSAPSLSSCAQNVSAAIGLGPIGSSMLPIPLLHSSQISFFEQGFMDNPQWNGFFNCVLPPCGDTVALRVTDSLNNQIVYIFQRATNYVEHAITNTASGGYREIFLDSAGGNFARNLFDDLAAIAGEDGPGKLIVGFEFSIASSGWAELDNLAITMGPQAAGLDVLTLLISGKGSVTPNLNGASIRIGSTNTVKAVPGSNQMFLNWSGSITSANPVLTFVMQSNMTLYANFIPNPFVPGRGSYYGLFAESGGVKQNSSGFFSATITPTSTGAAFSAAAQIGSATNSFSGSFDLAGHGHAARMSHGTNVLALDLQVDLTPGADRLTGMVSGPGWTADLIANRSMFSSTNKSPYAGKYTAAFPGWDGDVSLPGGDGFATFTIDTLGTMKLTGSLADVTPISRSIPVSKNGDVPLYLPLYAGKGLLEGWLSLTNGPQYDVTGNATWIKPANPTATRYPLGFTNDLVIQGTIYHAATTNRVLHMTNGIVWFAGAGLGSGFTNRIFLSASNKVFNLTGNKLTLVITNSAGTFGGTVTPPGSATGQTFKGVLLQNENGGFGYLQGTNGTVEVRLTPAE